MRVGQVWGQEVETKADVAIKCRLKEMVNLA